MFFVLLLLATAGAVDQQTTYTPYQASRGTALELLCNLPSCITTPTTIWFNATNGNLKTIQSGIDGKSGTLTVTNRVTGAVGGQKYKCKCGTSEKFYVIHVPPVVEIYVSSADVPVGGEVRVTCTATDGYPHIKTLELIHPGGRMKVENGKEIIFRANTSGRLFCTLPEIAGQQGERQHNAELQFNTFNRPVLMTVTNSTSAKDGEVATISCTILTLNCSTVVMFFKDGKPVDPEKNQRFILSHQAHREELKSFLSIDGVTSEDLGKYECRVYANYTSLQLITKQDVYLLKEPTTSTPPPTGGAATESPDCPLCLWSIPVMAFLLAITLILLIVLAILGVRHLRKRRCSRHKSSTTTGSCNV